MAGSTSGQMMIKLSNLGSLANVDPVKALIHRSHNITSPLTRNSPFPIV